MKMNKLIPLMLFSTSLVMTGCGKAPSVVANKLHDAYEFGSVESANSDYVRTMIETYYSNSYIDFSRGPISLSGYQQYRFSYKLVTTVMDTTIETWYDEFGSWINMGNTGFSTTYQFTMIDGVRQTASQVNKVSFTLAGDSLRGSVSNSGQVMGTFIMNNVAKRAPSYVSDANFKAKIRFDEEQDEVNKFIISMAYFGDSNECYYTYLDTYTSTQKCVVKEEGILTNVVVEQGGGFPVYELTVNKVIKYFHDEKISEQEVSITRKYQLIQGEIEGRNFAIFFDDFILNTYELAEQSPAPHPQR